MTCYRLHYGYCPRCKKVVYSRAKEPILAGDRIGVQARAVGGYLRYLGLPYRKVAKIFKDVFDLNLTYPSFLAFNTEQAQNGASLYQVIKQSIRQSPYMNADETSWRVNGQNHWLWVFTNKDTALYQIDKSRGSKVVRDILGERYRGVLISDFIRLITNFRPGLASVVWAIFWLRLRKYRRRINLLQRVSMACFARS